MSSPSTWTLELCHSELSAMCSEISLPFLVTLLVSPCLACTVYDFDSALVLVMHCPCFWSPGVLIKVVAWCMFAREQTSQSLKDATVSLVNFRHLCVFCPHLLSFHIKPFCAQLCTYNLAQNFAEAPAALPCNMRLHSASVVIHLPRDCREALEPLMVDTPQLRPSECCRQGDQVHISGDYGVARRGAGLCGSAQG